MFDNASIEAVRATALVKAFGEKRALDGVNFGVPRGQVCGLLGQFKCDRTLAEQCERLVFQSS